MDDERYFKVKQYATGRAFDNTSFIKLDISSLDPAYMTVKAIATVTGDINMTDVTPASDRRSGCYQERPRGDR